MNIRPMTMNDADNMLEWKNYLETRKFSIIPNSIINKEDHYKWLEKNIEYFSIIEDEETRVSIGALRIQDDEISIWIDKAFWGQGIASSILLHISKKGMTAKIVDGNVASMRAFISAGFKPIEYIDNSDFRRNHYIFKK